MFTTCRTRSVIADRQERCAHAVKALQPKHASVVSVIEKATRTRFARVRSSISRRILRNLANGNAQTTRVAQTLCVHTCGHTVGIIPRKCENIGVSALRERLLVSVSNSPGTRRNILLSVCTIRGLCAQSVEARSNHPKTCARITATSQGAPAVCFVHGVTSIWRVLRELSFRDFLRTAKSGRHVTPARLE